MPPTTTKKKKPAKPKRIAMPTEAEINAAEKDVTFWVHEHMQEWAIYAIKALNEAPWPEKKETPEWVGVLVEGFEWAVVAMAPQIGAALVTAKALLGKAATVASSTGLVKKPDETDIKKIFSDGLDRFRGQVEERIKKLFLRDWATDVALLRKDNPAKRLEEQLAYIWLQMFPMIDYDADKYFNLKSAIIRALAAAIPVFQQQLRDHAALSGACEAKAIRVTGGGRIAFDAVINQDEVDACYAALPAFTPKVSFKLTAAEGKVSRAPMVLTWMSMCTKY